MCISTWKTLEAYTFYYADVRIEVIENNVYYFCPRESNWKRDNRPRRVNAQRLKVFTGILEIIPVKRRSERVPGIYFVFGFTTGYTPGVYCLTPPNGTVGHSDFLSVIRNCRARQHHHQRVDRINHVLSKSRRHAFVVVVAHLDKTSRLSYAGFVRSHLHLVLVRVRYSPPSWPIDPRAYFPATGWLHLQCLSRTTSYSNKE